jgi:hypothetical protein
MGKPDRINDNGNRNNTSEQKYSILRKGENIFERLKRNTIFLIFTSMLMVLSTFGCENNEIESNYIGNKRQAGTWTWTPWGPPNCPTLSSGHVYTPSNISIDFQPKHIFESNYYANRTSRQWPIIFSQNVNFVQHNFTLISLGLDGDDYFGIGNLFGNYILNTSDNGNHGWYGPFTVKTIGNHNGAYFEYQWVTGTSSHTRNGSGYSIDGLRLSCVSTPSTVQNALFMMQNKPYDGALMGTGDVIYLWTVQPANQELLIIMWPIALENNADIDIFASTSPSITLPSKTNNTHESIYGIDSITGVTYPELIKIDSTTSDRNIYISVGSYEGKGHFRLYANALTSSKPSSSYPEEFSIITDYNPSVADKFTIKRILLKMSQAIYWATDGRHLIKTWNVYWNPDPKPPYPYMIFTEDFTYNQCGFTPWVPGSATKGVYSATAWCGCNRDASQGGNPSCTCTDNQEYNEAFAGGTGLHELGHCMYSFNDKYFDYPTKIGKYMCGHSIMETCQAASYNNTVDYCDNNNGGHDINPPANPPYWEGHETVLSQWLWLEALYPSIPPKNTSHTPDAFYQTGQQGSWDIPFYNLITINEN